MRHSFYAAPRTLLGSPWKALRGSLNKMYFCYKQEDPETTR